MDSPVMDSASSGFVVEVSSFVWMAFDGITAILKMDGITSTVELDTVFSGFWGISALEVGSSSTDFESLSVKVTRNGTFCVSTVVGRTIVKTLGNGGDEPVCKSARDDSGLDDGTPTMETDEGLEFTSKFADNGMVEKISTRSSDFDTRVGGEPRISGLFDVKDVINVVANNSSVTVRSGKSFVIYSLPKVNVIADPGMVIFFTGDRDEVSSGLVGGGTREVSNGVDSAAVEVDNELVNTSMVDSEGYPGIGTDKTGSERELRLDVGAPSSVGTINVNDLVNAA